MKKIAITGGICSGKSTICKTLEDLNFSVFYSDDIAKKLIKFNTQIRKEIIDEFGENSFLKVENSFQSLLGLKDDYIYNTKYISNVIFNDKSKLEILNNIFKPYIETKFNEFCKNCKDANEQIVFYESALIFEHNTQHMFDGVICVWAKIDVIIERLKERRNMSDIEIIQVLKNQLPAPDKLALTPHHIDTSNDGEYNYNIDLIKILNNFL
jgi:dephospho-CoA kinase